MKKKRKKNPPHTWTDPRTGELYALLTYTDRFGKRKYRYRKAESVAHARDLRKEMEAELRDQGEEALDARRLTFAQLAAFAEKHYVKEPTYAESLKVEGMRSWKDARGKLSVLCDYFGRRLVREITHEDLKAYKAERLKTPTRRDVAGHKGKGRPASTRKIASVNRELSLMRRVLNIAKRRKWIAANPFDGGELISNATEKKRTRVISREEEARLLAACESKTKPGELDSRRRHLRPIILCALDTGMRSGEIFKLRWSDVDIAGRAIHIRAFTTKDAEDRTVGMTPRLAAELERLWRESPKDPGGSVFGVTNKIKRSWASVCKDAGVANATPHDMRHTAATRMIEAGVPLPEVARVLGHANVATTYRYINATTGTAARAAQALHDWHEGGHQQASEAVN